MLLLKIQSLAYGHSGVTEEVMDRLVYFYNHDILPVVYELGYAGRIRRSGTAGAPESATGWSG
jgi:histidine ammonia-lyase